MFHNHWLLQLSQRWFPQRGTERIRRDPYVPNRKRRPAKPRLELLEDRLVLSATITEISTPPGDAITDVYGINSSGQVVGDMLASSNNSLVAFLYSSGQITNLGALPGVEGRDAYGINSSGQVVGRGDTSSALGVAFLYSNEKITDLNTLLQANSLWKLQDARAVNDSGQIVGDGFDGNSSNSGASAFLYSNGQITDLGTLPGGNGAVARAINSSGQVVGFSFTSTNSGGVDHAFLYDDGQMTDLGTLPGYSDSDAVGINDSGQVAGTSYTIGTNGNSTYQASLYSNGQMTALGTLPGDTQSVANGINDSGQVVGDSFIGSFDASHAFLYSDGQMIDLNSLLPANSGWVLTFAKAINDSGEIVGDGTLNGQARAFLLNLNLNVSLSPASLPAGVVNNSYTQTIAASGGIGDKTLSYKVTSSTIPDGLTFTPKSNELDISGTPTAVGTVTFSVTATDSASRPNSITQTYTLTINAATAPAITGNPGDQTVTAGTSVSFTASATGDPTPTVQWQVSSDGGKTFTNLSDGANVSGSATTTLTLNNVTADMKGDQYQAVFTNSAGSATTSATTLTVNPGVPPSITANPSSLSVTVGRTATFTASASGTPTPTVQWQVSTDGGKTFHDISGATSTTLTLNNVATDKNGYQYEAVFSNSAGGVATKAARLTVTAPPPPPGPPVLSVPPLLAFFDSLLGGIETVNANGTETIMDSLFGFPLLVSTFDSSGNLESVTLLGINVTLLFELL